MAKYLVLNKSTWLRLPNEACERMQDVGSIIDYPGVPGVSLFPLDDEARAARQRVLWKRNQSQRARDELQVRRFRADLPRAAQAILDPAMEEFAASLEQADARGKNMAP